MREGNEGTIKQLQKKITELLARIEELEEELENERKAKQKTELARKDLESQLEELNEQILVQGDATTAQAEVIYWDELSRWVDFARGLNFTMINKFEKSDLK